MEGFEFIDGDVGLINFVQPLWKKLNKHHKVSSNYFQNSFLSLKFEDRINKFINDDNLKIKVDLIKHIKSNLYIGYCISTINKELVGEIDSLFIEREYRKYGLGGSLMKRALDWLNDNQVKTKINNKVL